LVLRGLCDLRGYNKKSERRDLGGLASSGRRPSITTACGIRTLGPVFTVTQERKGANILPRRTQIPPRLMFSHKHTESHLRFVLRRVCALRGKTAVSRDSDLEVFALFAVNKEPSGEAWPTPL